MTAARRKMSAIRWAALKFAVTPPPGQNMSFNDTAACGKRARIPIVMTSDTPLPIPRSVICSPNHISNIVPVVRTNTVWIRYHQSTTGEHAVHAEHGIAGARVRLKEGCQRSAVQAGHANDRFQTANGKNQ